ncbi:MAG TPA: TonB-dependent receptor [Bacteroidales bacterium]|nr:MAG: TonB-dependent Receptor Plug Domain protein [Bacteroidetes bacterium ADurb.Bin012]HNQ58978.1 TonB-dependent receptor [Bacteroidales bacterium]HNU20778.1 TonB-dependent receptor [Bacteroidales bacterium]HNV16228.1 TonB-dependent receptor [Bacteroidales bacterium]HNZ78453.1 TonB-dependent receptor [Bacteroidales bacterium]
MNQIFRKLCMIVLIMIGAGSSFAQITTSGINGKVTGTNGESLPGATVILIHVPSGTQYGTTTDINGFYRIPNVNVGGPYTLKISYVGYEDFLKENIFLTLGQYSRINVSLAEKLSQISGVEITAERSAIFDLNRTGSETNITRDKIDKLPTIGRNLTDYTRLTPQARVQETSDGPNLTVAGMNNRYNAIFIDGAVNNDVFGLAGSGTNGGQTGISPFSMDAIDQLNIAIAPYDIKLGGFAGAGINAVTRRGTNEIEGSAYYYFRNQDLAGKTPTDDSNIERKKLPDFSSKTYGVRLGGPIIKDKVFFFGNVEIQKDETPQPFEFSTYEGNSDVDKISQLIEKVKSYGYDPGGFQGVIKKLDGTKIFGRVDWNINQNHKLTLRHQYTKGTKTEPGYQTNTNITFENAGIYFPSTTNSSALELKSIFGNKFANNLIVGLTFVRDDRDPMGQNFPYVSIRDGKGSINLGSEQFSTANQLDQDIITLTDNFEWYSGKHTLTFGTHNEFYNMYNLFIRQNFGVYTYNSIDDFLNNDTATQYDRTFSMTDGKTGDGSSAATKFKALQLGFYAQDEYQALDNLKLTFGLRVDIPMFLDDPIVNEDFNNNIIPVLEQNGWDLQGAQTGQMPDVHLLWSPRFGFNWDVFNDQSTQVRGGIGIFTSRIPYVWPGGVYNNNGLMLGGMRVTYVSNPTSPYLIFNPDWNNQPGWKPGDPVTPSGQIDLFAKNFKFPQVWRMSLAVDQKLPWDVIATGDVTYTKNINNVLYKNLAYKKSGLHLTGTGDNRPLWEKIDLQGAKYTDIMWATNTSLGYTYNLTAQLQKTFHNGLYTSLAYTFGAARSMNDGQSSQNSSQWRVPNVRGKNDLDFSISDFDMGHRIVGYISWKIDYLKHCATTIGFFYSGQSGQRFSWGYQDNTKSWLGEDNQSLELMYVPKDQNDIILLDVKDANGNIVISKEQQWNDLTAFIESDDYLRSRRGMYAERNAARTPFEHNIDLHLAQDFYVNVAGKRNTLQITFDIFNLGNFINSDWGRKYYVSGYYGNYPLLNFQGLKADADGNKTVPTFTFQKPKGEVWNIDDSGLISSRWMGQVGIRYIFN